MENKIFFLVHESGKKYGPFKSISTMIEDVALVILPYIYLHRDAAEKLGFKIMEHDNDP